MSASGTVKASWVHEKGAMDVTIFSTNIVSILSSVLSSLPILEQLSLMSPDSWIVKARS